MPAVAAQSRALVRCRLPCKSRESLRARGEQPGSASDVPACRIPRGAVHFSHYTSRNLVVPSTTSCLGRAEEHPGFAGGPRKKFLSRAFWKGIYHVTWHVAWVAGFPGICVRSRDSAPLARNRRSRGGARGRRRPPPANPRSAECYASMVKTHLSTCTPSTQQRDAKFCYRSCWV